MRTRPVGCLPRLPVALAVGSVLATALGCAPNVLTVEVLPPRTSVTCSAPAVGDPALGRGLLDASAIETERGGYLADLRFTVTGADTRVQGVTVTYTDALASTASAFNGEVLTGDIALVGEGDDIRRGVLENVALVSGDLARALNTDTGMGETTFKTLGIEILPIFASGGSVEATTNTFVLDVCRGCLVAEPTAEECPNGTSENPVCRPGQDAEQWSCASPIGGLP